MTSPANRRAADLELPDWLLARRSHGSLDAITDSGRRALRPIGATAREVAARTSALLTELLTLPSVRIFAGVSPPMQESPQVSHAVSAGSSLVLIESVAWPPGHYAVTAAGQIHCDGVYTGQSAAPLMAAVSHWRSCLPRGHRVRAVVVVYCECGGEVMLPAGSAHSPAWTRPPDAISCIRACLPAGRPAVSLRAIAALLAAVPGQAMPEGR